MTRKEELIDELLKECKNPENGGNSFDTAHNQNRLVIFWNLE